MRWLNYHHLFYFHTIAHEGSIAKASRVLRLGAPALSTQLRQLEGALGAELFERKTRRFVLTRIGKTVLGYADAIFNLGAELLEAVDEGRTTEAVRLDVGILDSVPKSVAHQLVTAALATGRCYVTVTEASSGELLKGLETHKLHLVLSNSPAPLAAGREFHSRRVGELPVVICGAPKFRALAKGFPRSLDGQPFFLPSADSRLRADLEHWLEAAGVRPRVVGESQESELDKRLALSGHALIAIARHAVEPQLKEKKLVRLGTLARIREQMWLTGVRRHVANPVAAELLATFRVRPGSAG